MLEEQIEIILTAEETADLLHALGIAFQALMPTDAMSVYDEDAGVYVRPEGGTEPIQVHLRAFAVFALHDLERALRGRQDAVVLGCIKWVPAPSGPLTPNGGTLSGSRAAVGNYLQNLAGLAWQAAVCRVGRPTQEEEARLKATNESDYELILAMVRESDVGMTKALRRITTV